MRYKNKPMEIWARSLTDTGIQNENTAEVTQRRLSLLLSYVLRFVCNRLEIAGVRYGNLEMPRSCVDQYFMHSPSDVQNVRDLAGVGTLNAGNMVV